MDIGSMVSNPSANAGDVRDMGSVPWSGRYPGEGNGNPLQYSCLENPLDEPGGLQSTGSQRIGHDWATSLHSTSHCTSDSCTMNCSASKKEQKHAICSSMDATRDYHTKWSKLERERRILYDHHLYVKSKIWHKWTYLQNTLKRHRKQTCGFQGGKERAGEAGEPGISRGKLLHTGRVNSKGYCVAQELYSMFCDKT